VPQAVKFKMSHYIVNPFTPEIFIKKINKTPEKKYASGAGKNVHGG
jgi:hypothetical protein